MEDIQVDSEIRGEYRKEKIKEMNWRNMTKTETMS